MVGSFQEESADGVPGEGRALPRFCASWAQSAGVMR